MAWETLAVENFGISTIGKKYFGELTQCTKMTNQTESLNSPESVQILMNSRKSTRKLMHVK